MALIPFRGLAQRGILKDPPPYLLDSNAWSAGNNVRFHGTKVTRAPAFRTVYDALPVAPYFGMGVRPATGSDSVFIMGPNQVTYRLQAGTLTNVSPTSYTPASTARNITGTVLGQVVYLNDSTQVPFSLTPSASLFTTLPNWDTTWRCRSLRAFNSQLLALNVTKGSVNFPNLVKISDLALQGQVPGSWDFTDATKNAAEYPLEDMQTPLVDGLPLRGAMILYASEDVWLMEIVGGTLLYSFKALFHDGGMLSPGCGAEVSGKHFILGPNDIYMHDGVTKTSLVDTKNRDYVFANLNVSQASACFVTYLPKYNSVLFAYQTGNSEAASAAALGCNKGLMYDLAGGTCSFIDLPNVHAATLASATGAYSYASVPAGATYATFGGSYWDQQSTIDAHVLMLSEAQSGVLTQSRVLGYDYANRGNLPFVLTSEASYPSYVERIGLSLDSEGSDLETSKLITRMFPLAKLYGLSAITFQVGSANAPEGPYKVAAAVSYNPATQYKVDMQVSGRYLSIRILQSANEDWDLSGFDLNVLPNGSR